MLELNKLNEKQRKLIRHSVCKCHFAERQQTVAFGVKADMGQNAQNDAFDPKRTLNALVCCTAQRAFTSRVVW
jgi:hypothetical protein